MKEMYADVSAEAWRYDFPRPDYKLSRQIIGRCLDSGNVLDIGCFRGDFLDTLPNNYRRYGIEPAASARQIACHRGVELIGEYLHELEVDEPMFHCITLLDVIEHLVDPLTALFTVKELLLPNGIVIVSTGNTDSLLWRLLRLDYWYYLPEHVSFFNPGWFQWAASKLGMKVIGIEKFAHRRGSPYERCRQFVSSLVFWLFETSKEYSSFHSIVGSVYPFKRVRQWPSAPRTNLWPDHMLVVLESDS
jgi:hypothetical protein